MAQIESEMDADTAKVQWKGYNDDGMPNVKKGSVIKRPIFCRGLKDP